MLVTERERVASDRERELLVTERELLVTERERVASDRERELLVTERES